MIPLVDVKAQYAPLIPELKERIAEVLDSGRFIFGPEVEAFEREAAAFLVRGGKKIAKRHEGELLPHLPKPIHPPQEHLFMNRLQWGLASVMAGIGGEGNYRRIAEPWIRGPLKPTE